MPLQDLIQQLKSKNPKLKRKAARELGELKAREAVKTLIETLADGGEARRDIIWALGKIGDPRAIDPLLQSLTDEDWRVRGQSAEALGEIGGGTGVVQALIKTLEDENDGVHWKAAWALGEIGDSQALKPLLAFLPDKDPRRCWHAAWALGRIGDKSAVEPLIPLLRHRDSLVRRHTLMALKMLKDPRATEAMIPLLDDPDSEVRHFAAEALIEIGKPAVDHLQRHLNQVREDIREKLEWILERVNEQNEE